MTKDDNNDDDDFVKKAIRLIDVVLFCLSFKWKLMQIVLYANANVLYEWI